MGKVTQKISEIRARTNLELVERFVHIVGARAIREYIAARPDKILNIEVRLTEEEFVRRLSKGKSLVSVKIS